MMKKYLLLSLLYLISTDSYGQVANDLKKSVPAWFSFNEDSNEAVIKILNDGNATKYDIEEVVYEPFLTSENIASIGGNVDSFIVENFQKGKLFEYKFEKFLGQTSPEGVGFLNFGVELPLIHDRGRCLLVIESSFKLQLEFEIKRLMEDMRMDGWDVEEVYILDEGVDQVKTIIQNWYSESYELSQSVFLLGHIPVPYSGNNAIDGHTNHQGAWAADLYYGDMDGVWTDNSVNNATASRVKNRNTPGDGKYDQTIIPSDIELEVGRVDFHDLPAFSDNKVELTRKYLDKNHAFRNGLRKLNRRGIVENNFANFAEGFGQNGWRNFVPMFGGDNVEVGNYDITLETEDYLFSYACGGGSYTSCSGVGTTQNLWASKELKSIFTMNFGSYFGDWDSQNNFLRSALASGDILANMWAGRPNWYVHSMALGTHIGYCAKLSQNASGFYSTGFGTRQIHIALLGDPTLRLHPLTPISNLAATSNHGNILLTWKPSEDEELGYHIFRKTDSSSWKLIAENVQDTFFEASCLERDIEYEFMIKAIRLEKSGSGSYYNSSQGVTVRANTEISSLPMSIFNLSNDYELVITENLSQNADSYFWEFGDGSTSIEESPTHIYDEKGVYEICLTIENNLCGSKQKCEMINVESSLPDSISYNIMEPSCFGASDGTIIAEYSAGAEDLNVYWNIGTVGDTLEDIPKGTYVINLEYEPAAKYLKDTIILQEPDQIEVNIELIETTGGYVMANPEITGGTPPYELIWGFEVDPNMIFEGEYTLKVIDLNNCMVEHNFSVILSNTSDINRELIKLYPNPANDMIVLESETHDLKNAKIYIIDTHGKLAQQFCEIKTSDKIKLNVSSLAPGLYQLILVGQENRYLEKLIITN